MWKFPLSLICEKKHCLRGQNTVRAAYGFDLFFPRHDVFSISRSPESGIRGAAIPRNSNDGRTRQLPENYWKSTGEVLVKYYICSAEAVNLPV